MDKWHIFTSNFLTFLFLYKQSSKSKEYYVIITYHSKSYPIHIPRTLEDIKSTNIEEFLIFNNVYTKKIMYFCNSE